MDNANDQAIRLLLQVVGREKLDELVKAFHSLESGGRDAAKGTTAVASAASQVAAPAARASKAIKDLGEAKEKTARSGANLGQSFLNLGRITQDFSQGGIAGILNNIEGLTASFGLGSGLAGVLTIAGVAAFVFKDKIAEVVEATGLLGERVGTDGLLGSFERLEKNIETTAKALDELKGKQSLTNVELVEFNRLTKEGEQLARMKEEETKKRAEDAALAGLRPENERARAAGFKKAVGEAGGGDAAFRLVNQALFNLAQQTGQEVSPVVIEEQARQLLRDAAGGDKTARGQITRAVGGFYPGPEGKKFVDLINAESPEAKVETERKAREDKERTAEGKRVEDIAEAGRKADEAKAKAAADQDKDAAKAMADRAKVDRDVRADAAKAIGDNTSLDERSLEQAVRARAMGGEAGARQGFERLANALTPEVQRAQPELSPDQARGVAVGMAGAATSQAKDMIDANLMRASDAGLRGQQANNFAISQTLSAVQSLMQRQEQAMRDAMNLGGMAAGMNRNVQARRGAGMGRGQWGG